MPGSFLDVDDTTMKNIAKTPYFMELTSSGRDSISRNK